MAETTAATTVRRGRPAAFGFRNIYILPSVDGLVLTTTLCVLFLIAVNYEIQLIYFTVFATGGCLNAAMILTHRNLHGIVPPAVSAAPAFAGDRCRISLRFAPSSVARIQLTATLRERRRRFWTSGATLATHDFHLEAHRAERVSLTIEAPGRGVHPVPPLSLSTRFPLGLFRAWIIVDPNARYVVYPRPAGNRPLPAADGAGTGSAAGTVSGSDEYYGLRRYREGDAVNRIAWRPSAKRDTLLIKEFTAPRDAAITLDYAALADLPDVEARLSQLTRWVLEADAAGMRYELRLGGLRFEADRGPRHRERCLTALAEF